MISLLKIVGEATPYIDFIFAALLIAGLVYLFFRYKLSHKVLICGSIFIGLFVLAFIFGLELVRDITIIGVVFYGIYISLLLTAPEKEIELRKNKKVCFF